jgi:hypothetical protein
LAAATVMVMLLASGDASSKTRTSSGPLNLPFKTS